MSFSRSRGAACLIDCTLANLCTQVAISKWQSASYAEGELDKQSCVLIAHQ